MTRRPTSLTRFAARTLTRAALVALASAWVATAQSPAADWLSIPQVEVDALEPAVAEQLGDLQAFVRDRIDDPTATVEELGEAFGELGSHCLAYELNRPAEESLAIAQRLGSEDFRWPYLRGYLAERDGRLEEAVSHYSRALEIVPDVSPALIRLAGTLMELDRRAEAEPLLDRALKINPIEAAGWAALGQLYLSDERYEPAIEALERALEYEPRADRLYYPLGLAYRGKGDADRARELLAKRGLVGIRPADPLIDGLAKLGTGERVHVLRGRAAFAASEFDQSVMEFRAALEAAPESVGARINLAAALAASDAAPEAIHHLQEAVRLAPGNATAHFNLALLLDDEGFPLVALESFNEAVSYAPDDPEMRLRLADGLRQMGRAEEALLHYSRAVALGPESEAAWVGQADALTQLDRFVEALDRLETASRLMPTGGIVAHALARLLAASPAPEIRDGERALELALRVVHVRPTVAHVQTVALANAEIGNCDEAAAWQRKAVEAASEQGHEEYALKLEETVGRYEAGPPCRPPIEEASS